MNLLRKMSGLRSSSDFSKENDSASAENEHAESPSDRNGEEEEVESVLTDPKLDDGDLFEDAAAALPGQQQPRQQQPDENLDPSASRIEQPAVLDELDLDDEVSAREGEEEVEDDGDDDGRGSHGSGESFDSALERMAALSEASYDGSLSPRISSPVGSVSDGIGNNPQNLRVFQEGALLRLNEMVSGDPSLDTSLIDNSTEQEFKSLVSQTAKSRGQSLEDSSFASIVDALLPLVIEKSEGKTSSDLDSAELGDDVDANSIEASNVDIEQSKPQSPIPQAKLTAEDESFAELEGGTEDAAAGVGALEKGGEDIEDVKAQNGQGEEDQDHAHLLGKGPIKSVGTEQESNGNSNFVPHSNGGHEDGLGQVPLTQARYLSEDEELGDDGQPAEHREEPVDETAGAVDTKDGCLPSQVSAVPSDSDDSFVPPQSTHESPTQESDEIGNNDENSVPADVHISSKQGEENQTGPVGKLSEDDVQSPQNQSEALSASSEVIPQDLPAEESEGTEVNSSVDEGGEEEHKSAQIPAEDEEEGGAKTSLLNGDDAEEGDQEEGEAETSLLNGDDAEEGDEEEKEEDEDSFMRRMIRNAEPGSSDDEEEAPPAPSLGSAGPSLPARPTRPVRSSLPSLEPAARAPQQPRSGERANIRSSSSATESQANDEPADGNEETREKLQSIRIKFLRLALRLGQSAHNVVVAQVLYRLGLAEQLRGGRGNNRNTAFSFDRASAIAEEQERAAGPEELDFACTIMMLGKTGVGKSATINSIFDEAKTGTNAFSPATNKVQVITGHVHGIKVRVIDTPGLLPSVVDQRHNERIMASVKGFIKKQSPDIVLYFDRLDMQSRDYGDLPLLRTITDTFGAAVWFNAIVVLTHASSAPPDGPNGLPLSYEMFVAQRSHVVQQTIRQAAGDMRLMNPVSLVENHRACRVNRSGESVLPNGQVWKPQLLLLCFASKILAEANSLLKLQDNSPGKPFGQRSRVPPLPFLLSSLLQSRTPLKLPDEQVGDEDESDEELEESESSDEEEDYDQLPPFRRLSKEEIAELDEENRANYYEELGERERLFQKKQWKEELKRRRETKKRMAEAPTDQSQFGPDDGLEEEARAATVPVPMPDMVLPPSFDSDNPSHRYRYLETANQWLVRPVLETHGWDHDNGYEGMNVEKMFVMGDKMPVSVSGQITKDKKEANLSMEAAASLKHGEDKVTLAGLDVQTVGKDLGYTLRSETRFNNFKGNKTTGGLAVTLLGDTVSAGMKIEDRLLLGKRLKLVVNGGAITGGGDIAYGGSLEATLRGKEFPFSRTLSTLGVSIMDWHNDLAVGGNFQSQFMLGKTMMVGRANLNNRGAGQISIRASSSDQLQMTLIGIIPIVRAIANRLFGESQQ